MHQILTKGATSQILTVTLRSATTGQRLTGKAYSAVTITAHRQGASPSAYTPVTMTAGTWVSQGWVETSDPGVYQLGVRNADIASGAEGCKITVTASGAIDKDIDVVLLDADLRNATSLGLSRVDAAVSADTSGVTTLLSRIIGTLAAGTHNPQTGDSYPIVSSGTHGNAALKSLIDAKASQSSVDAVSALISGLNNLSALANLYGSPLLEIPDSGDPDVAYAFTLVVRDNEGKLVALDGSPTITAANAAGTDRSANLSAVSNPSTGRYTFTYSVVDDATPESLRITCSGTVSAEARYIEWVGAVVDYDTLTTLLAVKAKTDNLPSAPASTGDVTSARDSVLTRLGTPAGASVSADIAAVKTDTGNLVTRITSTLFSGITSLAQWLGLMAGKQAGDATALTEMKATGAGSGTYDPTTDSLEAIKDTASAPSAATIADAVWDEALSGHATAGSAGAALSAASAPSAAAVADAVWDEALAGHAVAGSAGAALSAAGNAGDPWQTALPGAYSAGQAGYIIGNQPTAEEIAAELAGNNVVATFPLLIEGEETVIIQGEDYFDADGNAATVTITATGIEAAVADDWDFVFWGQGDSTGQVVAGSPSSGGANSITVKFDLPAAKTSLVTAGLGGWRVVHKPDGTTREFSEVEGILRVKPTK